MFDVVSLVQILKYRVFWFSKIELNIFDIQMIFENQRQIFDFIMRLIYMLLKCTYYIFGLDVRTEMTWICKDILKRYLISSRLQNLK